MADCPCKGCQDRKLGSHGPCERYQQWKADYEAGKPDPPEFTMTDKARHAWWWRIKHRERRGRKYE